MGLETTTYIDGLVATNPAAGDTLGQTDDHIRLLKSTLLNTFPNVTGAVSGSHSDLNALTEGPVFRAKRTSNQSVTSNVSTKVQLPTEDFDVGGFFDSATNYRFQPTTAGYYQINCAVYVTGTSITTVITSLQKNGVEIAGAFMTVPGAGDHKLAVSDVVQLNGSTDYIELWGTGVGTSPNFGTGSYLSGALIRPA
jgi:hypothetical protein